MNLTLEQKSIINTKEPSFKINAVAGSGKTTTLLLYAQKKSNLKILYLAYNKSLQISLQEKLKNYKLPNLNVSTIHSLAYNKIGAYNYKLTNELKTYILEKVLIKYELKTNQKSYYLSVEYLSLLKDLVNFYCNCALIQIDTKLLESYKKQCDLSAKILEVLVKNEKKILKHTKAILTAMKDKTIAATHDFYLKMFYLNRQISTNLGYDLILIDEAQDISDVMIAIIENQNCKRVYVGDSFQQIYSFRYAINALNKIDLPNFYLSKSFRFSNSYAKTLENLLNHLYTINQTQILNINGIDTSTKVGEEFIDFSKPFCVIARTTFGLIQELVKYIHDKKKIYFEGGYNTYSFMNQIVYSIFYLKQRKNEKITVDEIKRFNSIYELEIFAKDTKNQDYLNIIKFIHTYKDNIFEINKKIKYLLVSSKEKADIIFTTAHKAKGLEYDQVLMVNDFITKKDILNKKNPLSFQRINEELNIYYVAATRVKNSVKLANLHLDYNYNKEENQ